MLDNLHSVTPEKITSFNTSFKKGRAGTIAITVEWKDPKLAADMANVYVATLAEFMKDKPLNTMVQLIDRAVPAGGKILASDKPEHDGRGLS